MWSFSNPRICCTFFQLLRILMFKPQRFCQSGKILVLIFMSMMIIVMICHINLRRSNITCAVVYIVLTGLYMIYIYIQMMAFCCANASIKTHKPSVHKTPTFLVLLPKPVGKFAMLRCLSLLCKLLCIILQLFLKAAQHTRIGTTPTTKRLETGNHPPRPRNLKIRTHFRHLKTGIRASTTHFKI